MERTKIFTDTAIDTLSIERLVEKIFLEYMTDIEDAVDKCPAVQQQMPQLVTEFKESIADLIEAMQRLESGVTKTDINELASVRDKQQTALKAYFRAMQGLPDPEKQAAGEALMELAHKYDAHVGMGVDEQTGLLIVLISTIEQHYMPQIQLIGAEELFNRLKSLNDQVCQLQAQRDEEQAYRVDNTVTHFRGITTQAYRRLVKGINAAAYIIDATPYEGLIAFINSVILRYKRDYLHQSVSYPEVGDGEQTEGGEIVPPTEGEQPGEETTTPTKYTITFTHNGQTVGSMELEAGAAITAPAAPTGYHWVNVPATMPAKNVTIQSEADEQEPPSLT